MGVSFFSSFRYLLFISSFLFFFKIFFFGIFSLFYNEPELFYREKGRLFSLCVYFCF